MIENFYKKNAQFKFYQTGKYESIVICGQMS